MAKRKNSTALFEVMAAHRARQQALAGQSGADADSSLMTPPSSRPSTPRTSAPKPRPAAPSRSYSPPPGQLAATPSGPGLVEKGKLWLAAWKQKRQEQREAAAALAAAETEERQAVAAREAAARPRQSASPSKKQLVHSARSVDPADPTAGITARSLLSRPAPAPVIDDTDGLADEHVDPAVAEEAFLDEPAAYAEPGTSPARSTPANRLDATEMKPAGTNQVAIDRDRHEVTLKVRFTTAAISVTALLVVVGIAYIVGKRAGQPPVPKAVNGPAQKPAAQPGVLDPANQSRPRLTQRPAGAGEVRQASGRQLGEQEQSASIQPSGVAGRPDVSGTSAYPVAIENGAARRTAGLNYMVIAQYKYEQQDWAEEVCAYLNAAGVGCTIETGNGRMAAPGKYVLVGTLGFAPGFGASLDYVRYTQAIADAAEKFPQSHKFNRAQAGRTTMVKWLD